MIACRAPKSVIEKILSIAREELFSDLQPRAGENRRSLLVRNNPLADRCPLQGRKRGRDFF